MNVLRIIPVGNEAKLFFDRYKDVASQLKTQNYRNLFSLLLKRMGTILKTINSNLRIKPDAFRVYCQMTTDLITSHLKFVRISPTLHQVCLRYFIETIGVIYTMVKYALRWVHSSVWDLIMSPLFYFEFRGKLVFLLTPLNHKATNLVKRHPYRFSENNLQHKDYWLICFAYAVTIFSADI